MATSETDITTLCNDSRGGDKRSLRQLYSLAYDRIREIASDRMESERPFHTLQATEVAHEAFLKLHRADDLDLQDWSHLYAVVSQAMRRVLVSYARKKDTAKRGGDWLRIPLDEADLPVEHPAKLTIALDRALDDLEKVDERLAQTVVVRYFGGLSISEAAQALDVSTSTIKRDWRKAKMFLRNRLENETSAQT